MSHRIAIALMGKGAVNHLHRPAFIATLLARGLQVQFIVREDYRELIKPIEGCAYTTCRLTARASFKSTLAQSLQRIRTFYPAWDPGKRQRFKVANAEEKSWLRRGLNAGLHGLARFRGIMRLLVRIEGWLFDPAAVEGLDPQAFDQLILLGLGIFGTEAEGMLTWWARRNGVPVVHVVGNYDNLSSKGFRGVPVDHLLVWGANMVADAVKLHGVPPGKITPIGSIRYNGLLQETYPARDEFLRSRKLDPAKKTILFAGSMFEYHYFEMLSLFEELRRSNPNLQLILRLYPSKGLMQSPYTKPLIGYAAAVGGVHVSIGDPHYHSSDAGKEPIYIDETELWCILKYCDVVVNIFSSIALEACIFDKPAINMWYFQRRSKGFLRQPVYIDFAASFHTRRLTSYGAMRLATSRAELAAQIDYALRHPDELAAQRRRVLAEECGRIDGRAAERFWQACTEAYAARRAAG